MNKIIVKATVNCPRVQMTLQYVYCNAHNVWIWLVAEVDTAKGKSGGVAFDVIIKPASTDNPPQLLHGSPTKEHPPLSQEDIDRKLKEAEERRLVTLLISFLFLCKWVLHRHGMFGCQATDRRFNYPPGQKVFQDFCSKCTPSESTIRGSTPSREITLRRKGQKREPPALIF